MREQIKQAIDMRLGCHDYTDDELDTMTQGFIEQLSIKIVEENDELLKIVKFCMDKAK